MVRDNELTGEQLREALELYKSGNVGARELTAASKKFRKNFYLRFEKFLSANNWVFNETTVKKFLDFLQVREDGKPTSPASTATYIGCMRAFNSYLVNRGYLKKNFAKWFPKPSEDKTRHEVHLYDPKTIAKAIELGTMTRHGDRSRSIHIKQESRIALMFAQRTARRSGEILKLKGSDINDDGTYWANIKGGKRKLFVIPEDMKTIMLSRKNKEKVFECSAEVMIKHLRDGLRRLGYNDSETVIHDFRIYFAVERLGNERSIYNVSRALAHERVSTTERYYTKYVASDLAPTINDSVVIRHGIPLSQVITELETMVAKKVLDDDRFIKPIVRKEANKFVIELPFSKNGVNEMNSSK